MEQGQDVHGLVRCYREMVQSHEAAHLGLVEDSMEQGKDVLGLVRCKRWLVQPREAAYLGLVED
jgi:hypothetical protein